MAVLHPDGRVDVPICVVRPDDGLAADGSVTLWPGDDGYDQAAATAIPLHQHPVLGPDDPDRDAELQARFRAWDDAGRASA